MEQARNSIKSMTEGSPLRLLIRFALPLMLGNILQQLYVVVDTAIVGQGLGVTALASVGAADWLNWLVSGIAQGFTQGFGVLVAIHFGAKDFGQLQKAVSGALLLSILLAIALSIASQATLLPTLTAMSTPADVLPGAVLYVRTLYCGIPFTVAFNLCAAILRALGDSKTPLWAMAIASVVNIVLDSVFVFLFHWGIAGAAGATVFAQGLSAAFCLWRMRCIPYLRPVRLQLRKEGALFARLMRLGLPVAFQNVIIAVGGLIVQSAVNGYGMLFIAGFTATNKLYALLEIAAISLGYAISTFVGQNIGAKQYLRVRRGVHTGLVVGLGVSVVISVLMLTLGRFLVPLFISGTPEEVASATQTALAYLNTMSAFLSVLYVLYVYRSALQGMGNTLIPMVSGIAEFALRVAVVWTLPAIFGPNSIFFAEIAAWAGAAAILLSAYYVCVRSLPRADAPLA